MQKHSELAPSREFNLRQFLQRQLELPWGRGYGSPHVLQIAAAVCANCVPNIRAHVMKESNRVMSCR